MKNYNWLRWISVFPCAIAAYLIMYALMKACGYITLFFNSDDFGWVTNVTLPAFASGVGTYMYLKAGVHVAPKYKFITAIVLTAPMVIFVLLSFYVQIIHKIQWDSIIEEVAGLIGLACAFFQPKNGFYIQYKRNLENHSKYIPDTDFTNLTPEYKLTQKQIEAFRKIYKNPKMPESAIMLKIQATNQYKESLKKDIED